MAKCTFKTPEELGLTQEQFNALVMVSGMLERGELTHVPLLSSRTKVAKPFHMNHWDIKTRCGSVHCIGGWADAIEPEANFEDSRQTPELHHLFYPCNQGNDWSHLTPAQAGKALCHYLKTGDDGNRGWNIATGKEKA